MILVGNQRGGARYLADHLLKQENERVEVHQIRGFVCNDLHGAFQESYAVSRATRCKQHLYSLSLSPPKDANVSDDQFEAAVEKAEDRLGLSGQPRAIVFHVKDGRRHAHAVWCRIDTENMRSVHMSKDRDKLQDVARGLYIEHGWTMPKGFVSHEARDPRNYSLQEWQQAKRAKRDPKQLKGQFQEAWAISDSRQAFEAALKERGFFLARGDRRGHVAVDHTGEVYALARWTGQKTKDVKAKLGPIDNLLSVDQARDIASARVARRLEELKAEEAAKAQDQLDRIAKVKEALKQRHANDVQRLEAQQGQREAQENKEREARIRKGLMGLLDRLTGQRKRQQERNAEEAKQAVARDKMERNTLNLRGQHRQASLANKAKAREEKRHAIHSELSKDIETLRKPGNREDRKEAYEKVRRERPPRKRRSRSREGPMPEP